MKNVKFLAVAALAVAVCFCVYRLRPVPGNPAPTYDYQCTNCGYTFRYTVHNTAEDRPIIECPKCKAMAAERMMHFQCRKCWTKFNLPGPKATLANLVCPNCGSRAVRDLDNPIPGDDTPVEGGKPYPGK